MHTLLLLDDESAVMNLLRRVLKEYNLIEATTAQEALRLFMENHRQADLLIADLSLVNHLGNTSGVATSLRDSEFTCDSDIWVSAKQLDCQGFHGFGKAWGKLCDCF